MASHQKGPILAGHLNGPLNGLRIEAACGDSDFVTVFDDFDTTVGSDTFGGTTFEASGWLLTDVGVPTNDTVTQNTGTSGRMDSCLRLNAGDTADTGGNMQLSSTTSVFDFPHIKIPSNVVSATILDGTDYVFACRIGLISNAATWDGKLFIGWAEEMDTGLLTPSTGVITQPEGGPLVGFHVGEDGAISGISQRTVGTTYTAGTNVTELYAAGSPNGTANVAQWYDLAVHIHINDMSDNSNNGTTTFYKRRLPSSISTPIGPWVKHSTVLFNQTPNNNLNLTPAIEIVNGPTNQSDLAVDWWAFGATRFSRTGR